VGLPSCTERGVTATELHLSAAARLVLLTAAVVGAFALTVGPASANHVSCGDTIVADTTLDSDFVNCPNNGIVIGADGITLDLNGHLVDGNGTEAAGCDPDREPCDLGVANFGHDGVTVMNGSVREFSVGVLFGSTTAERVRNNRVLGVSSAQQPVRRPRVGFLGAKPAAK
jgi:hypothetical protein